MYILGISAFYHDSAACIIKDGEIIAAAQEERFTRKKHDFRFPINAINFCLNYSNLKIKDIEIVSFYDKPFLKFERLLETYLTYAPVGIKSFLKAMPLWIKEKLWMKELIKNELNFEGKILFPEHHLSHFASAFYPSPFDEAAILTMDGVGEWTTTSYGAGKGNKIELFADIKFPHSLGLLYSAFTYYTGFKVNSGEYKVMGLAPYGEPKFKQLIYDHLIDVKEDGSFKMNMEYFNYCAGLTMTNKKFDKLFGGPPRKPETKLTQREMDLARSLQEVTEEVVLKIGNHLYKETGLNNLTLAGGVALNCVANGRLLKTGPFENIWIQPAAGDAGGDRFIKSGNYKSQKFNENELIVKVSELIANEKVIGWFQGRMEFGPRALGSRTIIGDARSSDMQSKMNLKIKFRESFRPFAPSVLREKVSEYFDVNIDSPYMLLVADVKEERRKQMSDTEKKLFGIEKLKINRSDIPAITHVDYSARLQTVHSHTNPLYHKLIKRFETITGFSVIINTSFNVRGEPIVCSPEDAYLCFMRTDMDYLVLGNHLLAKNDQEPLLNDSNWKKEFELD
ncbi:MAG: carbamoyltransferase [Ignavibacteriaceae bacterium]